jgi:hypothetical protein
MEIYGAANCFHFAETKVLEPKFTCRKPGCSADFTRSGNLYEHKRNVHQTISYPCVKCGMYAENQITIGNHNVRCHGALASTSNQRFVISVTFAICSVKNKCLYLQRF